MELENQAAIIMGAGRGIGKAIAEKFYPEGLMPAVWDIEQGLTEGVAASLDPYGQKGIGTMRDEVITEGDNG